jgi:hypothetical protein
MTKYSPAFFLFAWCLMMTLTLPLGLLWEYWDLGSPTGRIFAAAFLDIYIFVMLVKAAD